MLANLGLTLFLAVASPTGEQISFCLFGCGDADALEQCYEACWEVFDVCMARGNCPCGRNDCLNLCADACWLDKDVCDAQCDAQYGPV